LEESYFRKGFVPEPASKGHWQETRFVIYLAKWYSIPATFVGGVCGIYYPVSILPRWVMFLAELIPLTYFLEYFRHFYAFEPAFSRVLLKGYAMVLGYLVIEVLFMKAALRRAKRTGMLLKLSE